MSKSLGAFVFVAGVAGLAIWGANVQAVSMQHEIAAAATEVAASHVHPLAARVSGRDITVAGIADTDEELASMAAEFDALRGRRVVNLDAVTVLPTITPYETALAKGTDGGLLALGHAPSAAARKALADRGVPVDGLALAAGAPPDWAEAMTSGADALASLEEGSFTLTDDTLTLAGLAATPFEEEAARAALEAPGAYQSVVALDLADPGIVDFTLDYDANTGFSLAGTLPEGIGAEGFSEALGTDVAMGQTDTTFAELPGLDAVLSGLVGALGQVETFALTGRNAGLSARAEAMAGVDAGGVSAALEQAFGRAAGAEVALDVTGTTPPPRDGTERVNPVTGIRQFAFGGAWRALPAGFETPTAELCATRAMERVEASPIRFLSGSAELDPASVETIDELAGIVNLCTREPGMRVTIGGHTDSTGDPERNYTLSAQRARAVRDALAARGVPAGRMMAVGYGETEPVADNETEEGRALNRRTTFAWPD